ncbi:MAG: hypothetical protein Q9221_005774 [Calogaya cf. arnoldii]
MTTTTTPRRILQDVSNIATSSTSSLKRQIHEVEDPNLPPSPLRSRPSNHTPSLGLKRPGLNPRADPPLPSQPNRESELKPASYTAVQTKSHDREDETVEESTQGSSKSTGSESVCSDMEGDTVDTQQTAATETSLPSGLSTISRAETLRLRLRVALFKVQTDQTNIPVSQLRLPTSSFPELNPSAPSSRRANVEPPRLLPAPILRLTVQPNGLPQSSQMLSSPPETRAGSPSKAPDSGNFRTPSLPLSKVRLSQQLSSPPNSQNGDVNDRDVEDSHLSSSAVKGEAAISLLGLRDDRR